MRIQLNSYHIPEFYDQDTIICTIFEKTKLQGVVLKSLDLIFNGRISDLIKQGVLTGKKGEITVVYGTSAKQPQTVLIAGLGKKESYDVDPLRYVAGELARSLRKVKAKTATWWMDSELIKAKTNSALWIQAMTEGLILGGYQFQEFKDLHKPKSETVCKNLVMRLPDTTKMTAKLKKSVKLGTLTATATNMARDLENRPANVLYPQKFVEIATYLFADMPNISISVISADEARELGMNAFLGVAQGSVHEPYFLTITYNGIPDSVTPTIAVVGKGVTFDSGGISIKPANNMDEMKGDMSGSAAVLTAMWTIAQLAPSKHILALLPLVENMPSGSAQRPGDIVTAMNGKTIEVINTDAEGRLILADAICYAVSKGVKEIVDIATLTGACSIALGDVASAIVGNHQPLIDRFLKQSKEIGERLWQLPLYSDYFDYLKSDVADMMNCSTNRLAGTATGAKFLEQFVDNAHWVHLDIASTNHDASTKGYAIRGMSGVGTRTLIGYLMA